jgi:hypothetical protein
MVHRTQKKIIVVDVTKQFGEMLEKHGFGSDSNASLDVTKAGVWDLLDAVSGKDNSKFTKEQAKKELDRRGL